MAQPTFVAHGSGAGDDSDPYEFNLPLPVGHTTDDILIMQLGCGGSSAVFTVPGGWTAIGSQVGGTNMQVKSWWKRDGGSESAPLCQCDSTNFYGIMFAIRGCVDSGTPFEDATYTSETRTTTPPTSEVTPTGSDRFLVAINSQEDNTDLTSGWPPSGWTAQKKERLGAGTDWMFNTMTYNSNPSSGVPISAVNFFTGGNELQLSLTLLMLPVPGVGWGHKFLGISNANISKALKIGKSNIEKILKIASIITDIKIPIKQGWSVIGSLIKNMKERTKEGEKRWYTTWT